MVAKLFVILEFVFLASAVSITQIEEQIPSDLSEQQPRIIGGEPTNIQNFPFAAPLLFSRRLVCGSIIISRNTLGSAASCFPTNGDVTGYEVRVGSTTLSSGGRLLSVIQFIFNPGYNPNTVDNDIGLIKVPGIQFSGTVLPANLAPPNFNVPDDATVITIGWGYVVSILIAQAPSEVLRSVALRTTSPARCQLTNAVTNINGKICARPPAARAAGPCNGDSGSALLFNNVVVGITSFRNAIAACGTPGFSYVFTRVSQYLDFIRANS